MWRAESDASGRDKGRDRSSLCPRQSRCAWRDHRPRGAIRRQFLLTGAACSFRKEFSTECEAQPSRRARNVSAMPAADSYSEVDSLASSDAAGAKVKIQTSRATNQTNRRLLAQ